MISTNFEEFWYHELMNERFCWRYKKEDMDEAQRLYLDHVQQANIQNGEGPDLRIQYLLAPRETSSFAKELAAAE